MPTSAHLAATPATIWTVGHSTRPLAGYRIEAIADVRIFPGSRKYPQYGKDVLAASLAGKAIGYEWLPRWAVVDGLRPIRRIQRGATPPFAAMPSSKSWARLCR
jgi:hypothetical protein